MANATNIRVADYRDGTVYHAFTALSSDAWTAIAGYGYNSQNWVTAIKFQVAAPASSVSFSWYAWNSEGGFRDLKYKITEGESSSYINATSSTAGDGTFTAESGQYSQTTFTASKNLKANTDYVLYIWTNRSTSYNSFTSIRVWNASTYPMTVTYTAAASYKLSLSVGSNVTASVTLNSSPFGRSGSVANNGTIYVGEVLRLTYSVSSGYAIATHTLNGSTVNSGATHTVAANVTIVLTAAASLSTISTSNGTFGTAQTITVTRYNSAYTHTIYATCAGQNQNIVTKSSSLSVSWTPAVSIMNSITNAMSASCVVTINTYNGDTYLGATQITVTLSLPISGTYSVKPTPSMSVSDAMGYASTYGGYVQGRSKAAVTVSDGLKYSATTASRSTSANGTTYTGASFTTNLLTSAGTNTFTTTVKDSRGQSGTGSASITVLAYSAPSISSFGVHRTDSSGTADDSGAYFVASYSVAITALNNHNTRSLTMRYKKATASTWTEVPVTLSAYTQSGNTTPVAITEGDSYDVQLVLTDAFGSTTKSTKLSTIPVTLDFNDDGTGIGVGKVAESSSLVDIAWSINAAGTINSNGVPLGKQSVVFQDWGSTYNSSTVTLYGRAFFTNYGNKYVRMRLVGRYVPDNSSSVYTVIPKSKVISAINTAFRTTYTAISDFWGAWNSVPAQSLGNLSYGATFQSAGDGTYLGFARVYNTSGSVGAWPHSTFYNGGDGYYMDIDITFLLS